MASRRPLQPFGMALRVESSIAVGAHVRRNNQKHRLKRFQASATACLAFAGFVESPFPVRNRMVFPSWVWLKINELGLRIYVIFVFGSVYPGAIAGSISFQPHPNEHCHRAQHLSHKTATHSQRPLAMGDWHGAWCLATASFLGLLSLQLVPRRKISP